MSWNKEEMAKEIISLFPDGSSVNLGIGIPSIVAEYIPSTLNLFIHSENGVIGVHGRPTEETCSPTLINAGKETIAIKPGASYFDSALSFGMIRGGHIDFCILGGMEVDLEGNLANWMIPGEKVTGMGGAMDLVNGAGCVIIMMKHYNKKGEAKLVEKTTLPLTGRSVVDLVITEYGIFRPNKSGFIIDKLAPGITAEELSLPVK